MNSAAFIMLPSYLSDLDSSGSVVVSSGAGATLMVRGRWYGWEHVRAFDSAGTCETFRKLLGSDLGRRSLDRAYDGLASYVAGRATKCVLAGSDY
jgi:hypothetical protein